MRLAVSRFACAHFHASTLPTANNAPNKPIFGRAIVSLLVFR
jgi:hypothetical protein